MKYCIVVFICFVMLSCASYDPAVVKEKLDIQSTPVQIFFAEYEQQPHLIQIDGSLSGATEYISEQYMEVYDVFLESFAKLYPTEVVAVRWSIGSGGFEYTEALEGVQISVAVFPNHASAFAGKPDQMELSFAIAVIENNAETLLPLTTIASVSGDWSEYVSDPTFLLDTLKQNVRSGTATYVSDLKGVE